MIAVKKLSEFLSFAGHPLLMTSVIMAVILYFSPELIGSVSIESRYQIIGLFFILTFIMPVLNITILRFSSNISSFTLEDRKERFLPYLFTAIFYGTTAWFILFHFEMGLYITVIFLSVFAVLLLSMIINFFWKISVHGAGVWGAVGIFLALNMKSPDNALFWPLFIIILLAGAVSSSRLYLGAHTPLQVYMGGLLGFIVCFFPVYINF